MADLFLVRKHGSFGETIKNKRRGSSRARDLKAISRPHPATEVDGLAAQ